jgi:dienelactone hydrolase
MLRKTKQMQIPSTLQPMLMGAAGGAVALAILGFTWGGWITASTAAANSKQAATTAVVAALAPICLDNFKRGKDPAAQLIELKKASSWQHGDFVEKGGWAKMPGMAKTDSGMARACAELIVADKT